MFCSGHLRCQTCIENLWVELKRAVDKPKNVKDLARICIDLHGPKIPPNIFLNLVKHYRKTTCTTLPVVDALSTKSGVSIMKPLFWQNLFY